MGLQSFKDRPVSYQIAAALLLCSGIVFVLGVASPYWYESDSASYGGLWSRCDTITENCASLTTNVTEGWWPALQVLEALGVICVTLSCSCVLFENCFTDTNAPSLVQESLGIVGGTLGMIGCFVFVGKTKSSSSILYSSYSWSFYLTIIGTVVVVIASTVIVIFGKAAGKSMRTTEPKEAPGSSDYSRRFSHLWAEQSSIDPTDLHMSPMASSGMSHDVTPKAPNTTPDNSRRPWETSVGDFGSPI